MATRSLASPATSGVVSPVVGSDAEVVIDSGTSSADSTAASADSTVLTADLT